MEQSEIRYWLTMNDPDMLENLWQEADALRAERFGPAVQLYGVIDLANYCQRKCPYCNMRTANKALPRYMMSLDEVLDTARLIRDFGYGTVVLRAGEDSRISRPWVAEIVRRVRNELGLAVILALGERDPHDLEAWYRAGAVGYLLRFETASLLRLNYFHPPQNGQTKRNRFDLLKILAEIGYRVGSGLLIGLPDQTPEELADALVLLRQLNPDIIDNGIYPVQQNTGRLQALMCKSNALARLLCPTAHMVANGLPQGLQNAHGREQALQSGANVLLTDFTPVGYRQFYGVFPGQHNQIGSISACHSRMVHMLQTLGRFPAARPLFGQSLRTH